VLHKATSCSAHPESVAEMWAEDSEAGPSAEAWGTMTENRPELLFRALRQEEVDAANNGGQLRPKAPGGDMSAEDAVGRGSKESVSKYVHFSTQFLPCAFYAQKGARVVAILDRRVVEDRHKGQVNDLCTAAGRREAGLTKGGDADRWAAGSREVLVECRAMECAGAVIGMLGRECTKLSRQPEKLSGTGECMEWRSAELASAGIRNAVNGLLGGEPGANKPTSRLLLSTDASAVEAPHHLAARLARKRGAQRFAQVMFQTTWHVPSRDVT
jgi:hypothetical protein